MVLPLPTLRELRETRLRLGLTQAAVAKLAGVSQPLIARIESEGVDPSYSTLRSIVTALNQAERSEIQLSDLMTDTVIAVKPQDTVQKAIEIMRQNDYSQIPVVARGVPVGSFSERCVLRQLEILKSVDELARLKVEDVMDPSLPMVERETSVEAAYRMLEQNPAILVMERGRLVGLVTKSDLLTLFK